MSIRFELPAELTIYSAAETARALTVWLAGQDGSGAPLQVTAHQVQDVDGAGLQLLAALHRSCASNGRRVLLHSPTGTLQTACARLGMHYLLPTSTDGVSA